MGGVKEGGIFFSEASIDSRERTWASDIRIFLLIEDSWIYFLKNASVILILS